MFSIFHLTKIFIIACNKHISSRKTPLRLAVNDSLGLRPFGGLSAFHTSISGPALQGAPDEARFVFGAKGSEKLAARRRRGHPVLPELPKRHEKVCGPQRRVICIFVSGDLQ